MTCLRSKLCWTGYWSWPHPVADPGCRCRKGGVLESVSPWQHNQRGVMETLRSLIWFPQFVFPCAAVKWQVPFLWCSKQTYVRVCAHIHMRVTQAHNYAVRRRLSGIIHRRIQLRGTYTCTRTHSIMIWQWAPFPPQVRLSSCAKCVCVCGNPAPVLFLKWAQTKASSQTALRTGPWEHEQWLLRHIVCVCVCMYEWEREGVREWIRLVSCKKSLVQAEEK